MRWVSSWADNFTSWWKKNNIKDAINVNLRDNFVKNKIRKWLIDSILKNRVQIAIFLNISKGTLTFDAVEKFVDTVFMDQWDSFVNQVW